MQMVNFKRFNKKAKSFKTEFEVLKNQNFFFYLIFFFKKTRQYVCIYLFCLNKNRFKNYTKKKKSFLYY